MRHSLFIFILLLVLNLCIVIGYLVWNMVRRKEKNLSIWMKAIVMLLCPVAGVVFFFFSYVLYSVFMSQAMDLDDVIFRKEKSQNFLKPDEERERNLASLEESLLISGKKELRMLMMNIIKGDYQHALSSISLALNSEDSETSHYAASVLQEVLNEFRVTVQNQYRACQEAKGEECFEHCLDLITYMNPILEQKVFTDMEQQSMVARMEQVCEQAWNIQPDKISSSIYEMVSMRLLEREAYDLCRKWCLRAAAQYPYTLASYSCQLKLYFSCKDREAFFRVLNEVKASDMILDSETLELIRMFQGT